MSKAYFSFLLGSFVVLLLNVMNILIPLNPIWIIGSILIAGFLYLGEKLKEIKRGY